LLRSFDLWFAARLPWIAALIALAVALWLVARSQRRRGEPA
jgi:paraquat-inducible protein B